MVSSFVSLGSLALLASTVFASEQITIPPHTTPGEETTTQWIAGPDSFDAPMNRPINDTSFDWWYFDIVEEPNAKGEQASIAITFHSTGRNGFNLIHDLSPVGMPSDNMVQINLAWPNGDLDAWLLMAGEAIITVDGDGASGDFTKSGGSFTGSPDLSQYSVHINAPQKGIVGTMRIQSETPAHYPCGPREEGQTMKVIPGVGWMNAIPDGFGEANFRIRGKEFSFQGSGYHDHNFGNQRFSDVCASAYWGHGRIGEYTVVWLSVLTPSGEESVSAYVTRNGEIITAQCGGLHIRPYGKNSQYPPTRGFESPTGFRMEIPTPDGLLELQAEYIYVTVSFDFYHRYTGTYTGTLDGEPLPDGYALWEQFSVAS